MDRTRLEQYFKDGEVVDIAEMYKRYDFPVQLHTTMIHPDAARARVKFLQEELDELMEAIEKNDILGQIDALVDIVVVAKGTATLMGIRWKYHWDEVHRANMAKEVGRNEKRPDLEHDLIKPRGWYGPDHLTVLDKHGRKG